MCTYHRNYNKIPYCSHDCQGCMFYEVERWHKFNDGWFEYYVNIDTGEKKFRLDEEDIEVDD